MAVHAAVGEQAHEVNGAALGDGAVDRLGEHGVVEERAVLDREVDARELLVDDAAGPDVEVPDLGVAHLALGQADGQPGRARAASWAHSAKDAVEVGRVRGLDGVARRGRGLAEAVHDDEQRWEVLRHLGVVPRRREHREERVGVQRRAADERAVDVGLGHEQRDVLGLGRAAVEDAQSESRPAGRRARRPWRGSSGTTSLAASGVGVRPVPMAQMGS